MIAPAELLSRATMCKQFSDAHTSTFAQATAAQYLKAGRMPATLDKVRSVYAQRAQTMGNALRRELGDAVEFVQPQGGLFVWARLTGAGGKVADGNVFAKRAIEQGVAFVPGTPFFCAKTVFPSINAGLEPSRSFSRTTAISALFAKNAVWSNRAVC
jgi:DNA-binding transcriptional MocR family regulator